MSTEGRGATPYYRPLGAELEVFRAARERRLPLLLQGPTGCGKTRFVTAMAHAVSAPVVSVACNEDTSSADLIGRFLLQGGDTVWQDGPVTRAVRAGAILYLDEIAEAREDVIVLLHSLTDDRRSLYIDRTNEVIQAGQGFQLIASYNPGYQRGLKDLKPSTRQRFIALSFRYPPESIESEIVERESGCESSVASRLVKLANMIRALTDMGLAETVSTRLLVHAALLITHGLEARAACIAAIVEPLSDDPDHLRVLRDLVALRF